MSGFVAFLILAMGFTSIRGTPRRYKTRAEVAAPLIETGMAAETAVWSKWDGPDPHQLVGAVALKESGLILDAVGADDEIGIMQINPNGLAKTLCTDLGWRDKPVDNIRCGIRILDRAHSSCPNKPPAVWLSRYKGIKYCKESLYSHRVMKILDLGKRTP